jgi:uncharacterized protein (TIGR02246 family)
MKQDISPDEQEIRQLVDRWIGATRAGDVDSVLALMTEDVVFLLPGSKVMRKADFAAAAHGQAGGRPAFEGTSEIEEIEVVGDWAFMRTHLTIAVTPPGGAPMKRAGHTLTIFRKVNGHWLIARDANLLAPVGG